MEQDSRPVGRRRSRPTAEGESTQPAADEGGPVRKRQDLRRSQDLGNCALCATALQPKGSKTLRSHEKELLPYNELLSNVTGEVKVLNLGDQVCKTCFRTDERRYKQLQNKFDTELLPRYWEAILNEKQANQEKQPECCVCLCNLVPCSTGGASTSYSGEAISSPNPAAYSSSKYGSNMLSWFFQQLSGRQCVFSGGKDLCSMHYQWFQKVKSLPQQYKDMIRKRTGKAWAGLSERECYLCGSCE